MKRSFRDEWTHELRTTTTPQTQGVLERLRPHTSRTVGNEPIMTHKPAGMCCIGVRCNLDYRKGLMVRGVDDVGGQAGYAELVAADETADFDYGNVDVSTALRWGVANMNQYGHSLLSELVIMNDTQRKSFIEIADFLDTLPVTEETGTYIDRLVVKGES